MTKPNQTNGSNPHNHKDIHGVGAALVYALIRTKCCTPLRPNSKTKVPK